MLPAALGLGFAAGRLGEKEGLKESTSGPQNTRETRTALRSPRADPFGGTSFSLSSMEDVHELFKRQGRSVASARLTLAVNSLKADEIPALIEMVQKEFRENPDRYDADSYALMGALFERWTLVDPAAAITFVNTCKSRSFQKAAASTCYGAMGRVDPDRALLEFEKLPKGEIRETAGMALVSTLSDTNPSAACDLLEKESNPGAFSDYYTAEIFATWAKTDPVRGRVQVTAGACALPSGARNAATSAARTFQVRTLSATPAIPRGCPSACTPGVEKTGNTGSAPIRVE